MPPISCTECLQAMSRGKSDLLARIACANCQQARADLAQAHKSLHEITSGGMFGVRCSMCGKWFLRRNGLASHWRTHALPVE